jgi:outer membrane protein OmpA-like peptidoglycan-associated protein
MFKNINNGTSIKTILTLFLLIKGFQLCSQNDREIRKHFTMAEHFFELKNYKKTIEHVLEIDKQPKTPLNENPDFNFIAGTSFWFSDTMKLRAIPHFEDYLKVTKEEVEVIIWLAKLYHMNYQYDKAKQRYIEYANYIKTDDQLSPSLQNKMLHEIDRAILSCEYGKMLSIIPSKSQIDNLGDSINTDYNEYAPVLNKFESELYFTRKSPNNKGGKKNEKGEYFEDIYHSTILDGSLLSRDSIKYSGFVHITDSMKFSYAKNIGEPINTEMHDAAIQLSHNDEQLFIYKNNHVWLSEKNIEKKFSVPHPIEGLSEILNSGNYEPSVSINANEDIIYFASERSGGYGGLDLYRTIKKNGVWQAAENLGPTINTEYDEDSPYIDPNNSTLYFSSKGHSSMGGYDIFKTYLIDSTWTYPMNMGFPLNSNSDDIFFAMTEKYNRGYFSSDRSGGKGKMDIYRISFASEREQLAEIRGKVKKGDKLIAAKSKLTVIDKLDDTAIAEYYSDSLTGDYHILLDHNNKYLVKVETEGFREYKRTFTIPEQEDYYSFYQEVHHVHLKDKNGNIIGHIVNIYGLKKDSINLNGLMESEAYMYITKDSLLKLMEEDSLLFGEQRKNTKLFFLNNNSPDLIDITAKDISEIEMQSRIKRQKEFLSQTNTTGVKNANEQKIIFYFPFNSYLLNDMQIDSLKSYFGNLYKEKKIPLLRIEGHTDSKGTQEYNKNLSRKRAKSVEATIKASHKLLKQMDLIASDESKLAATETTEDGKDNEAGRQLNRRVEITILIE